LVRLLIWSSFCSEALALLHGNIAPWRRFVWLLLLLSLRLIRWTIFDNNSHDLVLKVLSRFFSRVVLYNFLVFRILGSTPLWRSCRVVVVFRFHLSSHSMKLIIRGIIRLPIVIQDLLQNDFILILINHIWFWVLLLLLAKRGVNFSRLTIFNTVWHCSNIVG
jgi:hypothetical protein